MTRIKIFSSSLIGGFEEFRAAARSGIVALRHEPVVAEDFDAQANSPQIACLQGLRSAQRITHVALAASIETSDYVGRRTRAEHDASPKSATTRMGNAQQPISSTDRPRALLRFQATELAEDLMVPLRRQMKS